MVREAVAILTDASQAWLPEEAEWGRRSYRFAIFSTSGFSARALDLAFAHDVHLFDLSNPEYLSGVVEALSKVGMSTRSLSTLRNEFRLALDGSVEADRLRDDVAMVLDETLALPGAFIGVLYNGAPVFLIAHSRNVLELLQARESRNEDGQISVNVHMTEDDVWLLERDEQYLFSFRLPAQLVERYADQLDEDIKRLSFKEKAFREIQLFHSDGAGLLVVTLRLDMEWLHRMRARASKKSR